MKYNDVIDRLQNLTMSKINTTELADILNMPVRTLYTRSYRNSEVTPFELKKIEDFYNVNLFNSDSQNTTVNDDTELIEVEHIHINPSCGMGTVVIDEPDITPVKLGKKMIENILRVSSPENLKTFTASGDSMADTIDDMNVLLVDMGRTDYQNGGVFLIQKNNDWFVKRLRLRMTGELDIISDNPKYPIETFSQKDLVEIVIRGRVIKNLSKGL